MEVILGHSLQLNAIDLAGRVERHLVEEDDLLRCLVADALSAEDDQVGARGSLVSLNVPDRVSISPPPKQTHGCSRIQVL
jgi:hypothetical protein